MGRSGCRDLWPRRQILKLHSPHAASSARRKTLSLAPCCKWLRWWHRLVHSLLVAQVDLVVQVLLSLRVDPAHQPDPWGPSSRRAPALPGAPGWTSAATAPGGCLCSGGSLSPWLPSRSHGNRTPSDKIRASHSGQEFRQSSPWPESAPPAPEPAPRRKHQLRSSAPCVFAAFFQFDGLPACLRAIYLQKKESDPFLNCTATSGGGKVFKPLHKSNHPKLLRLGGSIQPAHLHLLQKTFRGDEDMKTAAFCKFQLIVRSNTEKMGSKWSATPFWNWRVRGGVEVMDGKESVRFFNQIGEDEQHTNTDATSNFENKKVLFFCLWSKRKGLFYMDQFSNWLFQSSILQYVVRAYPNNFNLIRSILDKRSHLSGSLCPIYHLEKIYRATERRRGVSRSCCWRMTPQIYWWNQCWATYRKSWQK